MLKVLFAASSTVTIGSAKATFATAYITFATASIAVTTTIKSNYQCIKSVFATNNKQHMHVLVLSLLVMTSDNTVQ